MAKRGRKIGSTPLVSTAGRLGTTLGHITARVEALNTERRALVGHIQTLVASAHQIMKDLGHGVAVGAGTQRRGGGRPKGYKMSAATRAKLRAAWARRKAAASGEGKNVAKKTRTMSAEARAKIAAAQRARWAKVKKAG